MRNVAKCFMVFENAYLIHGFVVTLLLVGVASLVLLLCRLLLSDCCKVGGYRNPELCAGLFLSMLYCRSCVPVYMCDECLYIAGVVCRFVCDECLYLAGVVCRFICVMNVSILPELCASFLL